MSLPLPLPLSPTTGEIRDGVFHFPLKIYYEDTDAGGIVYHASYLRFAERARTEWMRQIGWGHDRLFGEHGLTWVVQKLNIDYIRPARLDDTLVVTSLFQPPKGIRLNVLQQIYRDDVVIARLDLMVVLLSSNGRPGRIPAPLVHSLSSLS